MFPEKRLKNKKLKTRLCEKKEVYEQKTLMLYFRPVFTWSKQINVI